MVPDKYNSRKFWMNLIGLAIICAAFWTTNKISGLEFIGCVLGCTLGYGAVNALDKLFSFLHIGKTGGEQGGGHA